MRFKFKYLYSWGAQLSLVAANGGSSSLFGSPLDSDRWFAVEGLFVLLFMFIAEGILSMLCPEAGTL